MCIEWNDDWLIKDNYEHKNSNNMNEYRGFKVGDRVEITFSSAHPIKGTITSFGDRKLGGFAEPDTMDVWISETTRYDMIYLVSHDLIKKLPKYAVGDVVRRNNKQLIKCEITSVDQLCDKTHIYTLSDCGSARFSESMLITFDGFRVGDTVFTVKRGKGKIVADRESMPRRFKVVFDADKDHPTIICRHPKLTNLIPTEAEYKEALNKAGYAFKIDVEYVEEYKPKPNSIIETRINALRTEAEKIEKAAQAMNLIHSAAKIWANAFGRTTDQIKFPSGGVVFSGGTGVRGEYCEPFTSKKLTFTRSTEGKLEVVDDGVEKKYRCSKFAVHELVSYAGCIRAVVDKIHYKDGKFTYDLRTNSCSEGLPEDSLSAVVAHSAKFKVGDAVKYGGSKASISMVSTKRGGIFYAVRNDGWTNDIKGIPESALRLWVETKLTHCLQTLSNTWYPTSCVSKYEKIIHLGGFRIDGETRDIFACYGKNGKLILWAGIKGDDTTESI